MKVEDFILKLKANTPSIVNYINNGYSEKLAIKAVSTYNVEKTKGESNYNDELLKLVDCFSAKNLEIGIVKFYENIIEADDYFIVGEVEADWLVVDKLTGITRVIELHSAENLWDCAANGSRFLDAVLEVKLYITKSSLDENLLNQKITCLVAEECSTIAGGEQFLDFYKMLLGCFE